MISRLHGTLLEAGANIVVIDVCGVGYDVFLAPSFSYALPAVGDACTLFIRQIFREDGTSLYGFLTKDQRHLFDQLLEVKGCGPKLAISVIGELGEMTVVSAIVALDVKALVKAPGVGARLAERIILELKDKVLLQSHMRAAIQVTPPPEDELIAALTALGVRRSDADRVASDARLEATSIEAQIPIALRMLKK